MIHLLWEMTLAFFKRPETFLSVLAALFIGVVVGIFYEKINQNRKEKDA